MNWKNRILRIALALGIAAAIALQIPNRGGVAVAQDTYGGGGGGGARTLIQATVFALVGYGIYATATGGAVPSAPAPLPGADPNAAPAVPAPGEPIWDVTNNDSNLNKFAEVSEKAGYKETLRRPGKYTAFVPTNNAFSALDQQVLDDLMKEENKAKLADIIGFHVVEGEYTIEKLKADVAAAGSDGLKLTSLNMKPLVITNDGGLKINGTPIVETDIPASNGVIHPISSVLMPPSEE